MAGNYKPIKYNWGQGKDTGRGRNGRVPFPQTKRKSKKNLYKIKKNKFCFLDSGESGYDSRGWMLGWCELINKISNLIKLI